MRNLILKQSLIKRYILFPFFTIWCVFICEKALAAKWGLNCCEVFQDLQQSKLKIRYKFFESDMLANNKNSFLEKLEIQYSTDGGANFTYLMSTCTTDQNESENWSWIGIITKKIGEKIELLFHPFDKEEAITIPWTDNLSKTKIRVKNHPKFKNQTWFCLIWSHSLFKERKNNVTHIRIAGIWLEYGVRQNKFAVITFELKPKKEKLNSNNLNYFKSSLIPEIKTETKINEIHVCKEANTIVVKGAQIKIIYVYSTTGKLLKSMVADCDIFQITLPKNQHYIVKVGQLSYKIAL